MSNIAFAALSSLDCDLLQLRYKIDKDINLDEFNLIMS